MFQLIRRSLELPYRGYSALFVVNIYHKLSTNIYINKMFVRFHLKFIVHLLNSRNPFLTFRIIKSK